MDGQSLEGASELIEYGDAFRYDNDLQYNVLY